MILLLAKLVKIEVLDFDFNRLVFQNLLNAYYSQYPRVRWSSIVWLNDSGFNPLLLQSDAIVYKY